ncbi:phenazine-specific anthranilate synthase component I [Streptomyces solincola]|uniref:anthranilate synthase n=1 Tax=Streptomyces solincola TaxID=2100817 RepID=A0A2S9PQ23_9ACTN|nr:anthranilate synthase family protein [Streptomyces solincola]PRH76519.1 phenazine-specific anthranilate synthase component I [Streptomyces solincola]
MTGPHPAAPHHPDLLARIIEGDPPAYALLHRPHTAGPGVVEVLAGDVTACAALADVPLPEGAGEGPGGHEVLALLPYRQLAERGFAAVDDGEPLLVLTVAAQDALPLAETLRRLPDGPVHLTGGGFDTDDDAYAATVRRVIAEEIGTGEGANFVIKRNFTADITGYTPAAALSCFRRLLERETGAYWTFLIHTGDRTFVGATPERHVSLHDGTAVMNPISGTYRYPADGPALDGVLDFLGDPKETDELYMVVDEELKMMARICESGGRVTGPHLKEMARLAHTEYFIEGRTGLDVRDILRETLFAPTVTGSPLESAAKVISRHEPAGRGYYSGVAALIGRDAAGRREMDSGILIRTADIDRRGRLRIGVGATLVRHSDPESEVAETRAKAAGLLAALDGGASTRLATQPQVLRALARRNDTIADFWLTGDPAGAAADAAALAGRSVLVVDAEDTFTSMIGHQLTSLGLTVTVRRFDEPYDPDAHDLVIMGPGPGDPRATGDPKIAHLRGAVTRLLESRRPFMAVCLSHQVLATLLGLPLVRLEVPNQGVQREIDLFGRPERVGFYNTFTARSDADKTEHPVRGVVEVCRDPGSGQVHALRGAGFASAQFHAESLLSQHGVAITASLLKEVLRSCTP